jgi:tRNA-binding EMAP/Myf-like protein
MPQRKKVGTLTIKTKKLILLLGGKMLLSFEEVNQFSENIRIAFIYENPDNVFLL